MPTKTIDTAQFKTNCFRIIDQMIKDQEPVTITKRGRPVAVLSPIESRKRRFSIIGALRGSASLYEEPFAPAAGIEEWNAMQ